AGVKSSSTICSLSSVCNDSVFYLGEIIFHYNEENSTTLDVKMSKDVANDTLTENLPSNELTTFSFFFSPHGSVSNCTFKIKVNKTADICNLVVALNQAEIHPMERCCCSSRTCCPSTVDELEKLQCDKEDPVVCDGGSKRSENPSLPPPGKPTTTLPLATLPFSSPSAVPLVTPQILPTVTQILTPLISSSAWEISGSPTQPSTITPSIRTIILPPQPSPVTPTAPETSTSTPSTSPAQPRGSPSVISANTSEGPTGLPYINTENFTSPAVNAAEIENILSQMERTVSLGDVEPDLAGKMVTNVSHLLHAPPALLAPWAKRLMKLVDNIGLKLNFSTEVINFTSPSLALSVVKVNASIFKETSFSAQGPSDLQVTLGTQVSANSIGTITLPSSLLDNLSAKDVELASRIQFNFYETTSLFQDPSLQNLSLISYVISSSVANLTIKNLSENVTIALQNTSPNQDNSSVKCAFWNFSKNDGEGGWASEGCMVKDRKVNETVCTCNHLTIFENEFFFSFQDLSRPPLPPIQVLILTFITYIGCGLSAIFLSVTLVTYIAFEKVRRDYPSKILIQLCAALLLLNLVFLLDSWIALYNVRGLCISVAVFLHYFLLVSFTWMGLEAFHMYLALVKVFNTYIRKYILKFCIVGWGVPAVVVAIVLAISPDNYGQGSYGRFPNGSPDEFCWIKNNVVFYITVVGYFCVIFLLNVSMFIVVLIQLCRIKKKKQLGTQRKTSIQDLRSVAGLTFLLGITWGFAFFAWGPVNLIFMYLFAVFNTLQGFFIFVFYCVAKENVRKQWRRYLCCGRYRLAENSDWSRTATNGLKKQNVNQGVSSSSNSLQSNSNSTNSTTLLVNDCSIHSNGNVHVSTERNGVSFNVQNGDVCLHDFSGKQLILNEKNDASNNKNRISLRRTSKRGSLHFIEQM
uniref:Adhesion G-protein coupled receptor G2 n=1 Tax=Ornithorhynchus anatinus TaxID=9258 RepID=F6ZAD7_ORNAN